MEYIFVNILLPIFGIILSFYILGWIFYVK